jgi:uncharacterized phage protein gp47/JayE
MPIVAPPRFEDILADHITYFAAQSARATDFNPGSVTRTILEIIAQVQERRDVAAWATLNNAIDEAVLDAWGFSRREAIPSTGQITLYRAIGETTPFVVRQGDLFRVPGSTINVYEVISADRNTDGTSGWVDLAGTAWTAESAGAINHFTLNVQCVVPGLVGNVSRGLITQPDRGIPGIAAVRNNRAFTNGLDTATDAERRAEFTAYIQALPRGTVDAIKFGARTAVLLDSFGTIKSRVRKVDLIEGAGTVDVYINDGATNSNTPLVDQCQRVLDGYVDERGIKQDGWRAAGIRATVHYATQQSVSVRVNVTVAAGYQLENVAALVQQAIQTIFNSLDVGQSLLRNDVLMFIKLVPGVLDAEIYEWASNRLTPTGLFQTKNCTPAHQTLLWLANVQGTAVLGTKSINFGNS